MGFYEEFPGNYHCPSCGRLTHSEFCRCDYLHATDRIQELKQQLDDARKDRATWERSFYEKEHEVERLKKEFDDWIKHKAFLDEALDGCYEEMDRLRGALRRYGEHEADCAFYNYAQDSECNCGYEKISRQVLEE